MNEEDLISQLKKLKAVEPDKNWLMAARNEVLSKTPVFDVAVKTQNLGGFNISAVRAGDKTPGFFGDYHCRDEKSFVLSENSGENKERKFSFSTLFNFKQLQPAMASLIIGAMILGGGSILTVRASQNSLPGDSLYGIKRMMEGTQITIASSKNKPALETEFVGRRLEEMVRISESVSDVEQEGKIKKLAREVEEGMKKTENHLAALSESPKEAAKAAKTVNVQTEKYAAVLVEASGKLSEPVKKEVEETMDKAAESTEKVNFQTLATLGNSDKDALEKAGISEEEVAALIQEEIESRILNLESGDDENTEQAEIKTDKAEAEIDEIEIEIEKIEVDCLECGEDGEEICLEEVDDDGNTECYIERAVLTAEDRLNEALEKSGKGDSSGAMKILEEEDGDVKGAAEEGVLGEIDEEGVLDDGLEATNE